MVTANEARAHLAEATVERASPFGTVHEDHPDYQGDHLVRVTLMPGIAQSYEVPDPYMPGKTRTIEEPSVFEAPLNLVSPDGKSLLIGGSISIRLADIASIERLCSHGEAADHPS